MARRLAERGLSVVVLEAGKRFGIHNPLENTEANASQIMWSEPRNQVSANFIVPRPHYERVEREFGVAGECGPFAPEDYTLPMPPHQMNWHAQLLAKGALSPLRLPLPSILLSETVDLPASIAVGVARGVRRKPRRRQRTPT